MNLAPSVGLGPIVAAPRPLEKVQATLYGERKGFFMIDGDDPHTLCRLTDPMKPALH